MLRCLQTHYNDVCTLILSLLFLLFLLVYICDCWREIRADWNNNSGWESNVGPVYIRLKHTIYCNNFVKLFPFMPYTQELLCIIKTDILSNVIWNAFKENCSLYCYIPAVYPCPYPDMPIFYSTVLHLLTHTYTTECKFKNALQELYDDISSNMSLLCSSRNELYQNFVFALRKWLVIFLDSLMTSVYSLFPFFRMLTFLFLEPVLVLELLSSGCFIFFVRRSAILIHTK